MSILSHRWRCAVLVTLPVGLGCEIGSTVPRPTCAELAQGLGGMAGNEPVAGSAGTVYGVTAGDGGFTPTPFLAPPLVQENMPEDPGPKCLDCTQGRDIEHVIVIDFEDGYAPAWFSFDEKQYPRSPRPTPDNTPQEPPYWGLHVTDLSASPARTRCGSKFALRLQGGPYSQWGGGAGTSYFRLKGAQKELYCPSLVRDLTDPSVPQDECGFALAPDYEQVSIGPMQPTQRHLVASAWGKSVSGFDASQFEGVAFWARRAPGGQASLQVSIEDFNTNDSAAKAAQIESVTGDFAPDGVPRLNGREPACTRARECCAPISIDGVERPRCNVVNVTYAPGVTPYGYSDAASDAALPESREVEEYRCYVAELDNRPPPVRVEKPADGATNPEWEAWNSWQSDFPLCCPTDFEDPQFGKAQTLESSARERQKACSPYVVEGNFENSGTYYCWDEGDPPIPPADRNRCGDGFRAFVNVSTEWKLFKVPWRELRRMTPGKPPIDVSSIWAVAFYWRQGMLDTYLDDFGFYKEKRP